MVDIRIASKDDIDRMMNIRLEMLKVVNDLPEDYEYPDELDEPMSICDFINSEYKAMLEAGYDNYNDYIAGL